MDKQILFDDGSLENEFLLFGTEQFFVVRIPDEDRKNPHFNPLVSAEDQFLEFSCKETCCEYDVRIVLMNAHCVNECDYSSQKIG